jgi:hypothetical protein
LLKLALNPLSAEAVATRLGKWAFLREILIALVLSLPLPLVWVIGETVWHQTPKANRLGVAVGMFVAAYVIAGPVLLYASVRLNAASVARERTVKGAGKVRIHRFYGMAWPFPRPRAILPSSTRSRILCCFPACVSFGLLFAKVSHAMTGSPWTDIHLLLVGFILVQAMVAVSLLVGDAR